MRLYNVIKTTRRNDRFGTSVCTYETREEALKKLFAMASKDALVSEADGWDYTEPEPGMTEYTSTGTGVCYDDFTHIVLAESLTDTDGDGQPRQSCRNEKPEIPVNGTVTLRCVETKDFGSRCCDKCVFGQSLKDCPYECRARFRSDNRNVRFVFDKTGKP